MRVPVEVKFCEDELKDILAERLGINKEFIRFSIIRTGLNEGARIECIVRAEVEFQQGKPPDFTAFSRKDRNA